MDTGKLFCEMLNDLVLLSNQCEITNEWIIGAPLEELPLVEQIPVLHRLGKIEYFQSNLLKVQNYCRSFDPHD